MRAKRWISLILSVGLFCCYTVSTAGALPTSVLCGCDINCDGTVDLADLVAVSSRYGTWVPPGTPEDTNQDGKVDLFDLVCVAAHYQSPVWDAGAPVVKVAVTCSQFDAPGDDDCNLNEEYVCFEQVGGGSADMTGWHVKDEQNHTYTFPPFVLPAGVCVRLYTGSGPNGPTDLYWGSSEAVWNNDYDTVFLYDAAWRPVDQYVYGQRR
mgnify:CR=1 FL=1